MKKDKYQREYNNNLYNDKALTGQKDDDESNIDDETSILENINKIFSFFDEKIIVTENTKIEDIDPEQLKENNISQSELNTNIEFLQSLNDEDCAAFARTFSDVFAMEMISDSENLGDVGDLTDEEKDRCYKKINETIKKFELGEIE